MATQAHTVPQFYLRGFADPASENVPKLDPFVWVGSLTTGEIRRRAPRNISIVPGLYDGSGGLSEPNALLEVHLGKIESAAATTTAADRLGCDFLGLDQSMKP